MIAFSYPVIETAIVANAWHVTIEKNNMRNLRQFFPKGLKASSSCFGGRTDGQTPALQTNSIVMGFVPKARPENYLPEVQGSTFNHDARYSSSKKWGYFFRCFQSHFSLLNGQVETNLPLIRRYPVVYALDFEKGKTYFEVVSEILIMGGTTL